MASSSSPAAAILYLAVAGMGVPLMLGGCAGLLAGGAADPVALFFLGGFLLAGALMTGGSLYNLVQWWGQVQLERRETVQLKARTHVQELARWRVTEAQIASAAKDEWFTVIVEVVTIDVVLVGVGICGGRDDFAWLAVCLAMAFVVTLGRLIQVYGRISARSMGREVIFTTRSVRIGADMHRWDPPYGLDGVSLTDAGLEVKIGWNSREGVRLNDVVVVPVPPEHEADARAVVAVLSSI
jgi:hypothetical protein